MYDSLKSTLLELLKRTRPLKPQSERHVAHYLTEHSLDMASFFTRAVELLEDHELEILFAPEFTPTLAEQAAVSEILSKFRPSSEEIASLNSEIATSKSLATIELPDGQRVTLPLHEVMVERFIKLLRMEHAPEFALVAKLQDALPSELYIIAAALLRQRHFNAERQTWFVTFICHLARKQNITPSLLVATGQFATAQTQFDQPSLLKAAHELVRAAKGSVEYAQAGRMYWSPDVAQHHQYRGEGHVDSALVAQRRDELNSLEIIAAALESFAV